MFLFLLVLHLLCVCFVLHGFYFCGHMLVAFIIITLIICVGALIPSIILRTHDYLTRPHKKRISELMVCLLIIGRSQYICKVFRYIRNTIKDKIVNIIRWGCHHLFFPVHGVFGSATFGYWGGMACRRPNVHGSQLCQ